MRPRPFTLLMLVAGLGGLFFGSYSTYDFVQHLDRQVHGIHCSFIPGLAAADISGTSGCQITLMSPYSSVFRSAVWGGIPIALGAMGVFAFLVFRVLDFWLNDRQEDKGLARWLLTAWLVPALTSVVMSYIAFTMLDAACKLCIGIYISSFFGLVGAIGAWMGAGRPNRDGPLGFAMGPAPDSGMREGLFGLGQAVGFVAVPTLVYLVLQPDQSGYIGTCGTLLKADDPYGVMIPLNDAGAKGGAPTIEVFDPLCPSCRGTERRLEASGLGGRLDRKLVLFPLDNTCNWMVGETVHPGACTISEAVLCAGDKADLVIDWAFENQEAIRAAAKADPNAAASMVAAKFPELKSCVGSSTAKQKLNKSLRWAVQNQLPVLTPQIYVDGVKVCDEDTDLGMDYALTRLLDKRDRGELKAAAGGAK